MIEYLLNKIAKRLKEDISLEERSRLLLLKFNIERQINAPLVEIENQVERVLQSHSAKL